MPNFDYITAREFRESLEADHAEMRKCSDVEAWKSVQVLAGSIVESLLIDYLVSTTNPARSGKDPLKMDLAEAIAMCRAESVLSQRTTDLCSVIRSYRNLIHPGRMVRLGEPPPDRGSSSIALALVDIIAEELAKVRRATVGLTAEQILSKVMRDANSLTILKHLLQETTEQQRERLLVDLIPTAHQQEKVEVDPWDSDNARERLTMAYRMILESVSRELRMRVASEFVRVLREEDGGRVVEYGDAFFAPSDLAFVSVQHQAMVRAHLLGRVSNTHTPHSLRLVSGIGPYLQPAEVLKWLDPYIRTLFSTSVNDVVKEKARETLIDDACGASSDVDTAVNRRIDEWIKHYENHDVPGNVELLQELRVDIYALRISF